MYDDVFDDVTDRAQHGGRSYTERRSRAPVSLDGWRNLLIARASI
jgi:hypothetical protein